MSDKETRPRPYVYPAICRRVIDGDTIVCDVDMGHYQWRHDSRIRLLGVDAPEPRGETKEVGLAVAAFVRELLPSGKRVTIESKELDSFGRMLAVVWVNGTETLNDLLVAQGWGDKKEKTND